MTSAINFQGVDATFPIQGQDNDSQGFRDNFTYIKDGLAVAYSEITELQNKVILKYPLGVTPPVGVEIPVGNDLGFSRLNNAITTNVYGLAYLPAGSTTTSPVINIAADGRTYYRYVVGNGMTTIDFVNWPEDLEAQPVFTKIRVEFVSDGTARDVEFAVAGNKFISSGLNIAAISTPATAGDSVIIDVWSTDLGANIYFAKVDDFRFTV